MSNSEYKPTDSELRMDAVRNYAIEKGEPFELDPSLAKAYRNYCEKIGREFDAVIIDPFANQEPVMLQFDGKGFVKVQGE